jgi:acyl-CoA synthetase (AMP-forming)/AMP-acid ligase II
MKECDPAAIIFTTGSTGPPKGVLYEHGNFAHQVQQIRDRYGIGPGEVDLPGFPLFGLFNAAMGVTTVIPDMDPTRPARVDPRRIVRAAEDWKVTQAFGSPAMWNAVGRYCEQHQIRIPTMRRVLSAGAPVPVHVLRRMKQAMAADGQVHTPYGATEALPVASISATEVLTETAAVSARGGGTCVGRRFDGIQWRVIRIRDQAIDHPSEMEVLPAGEIGELIVRGPVVTRCYVTGVQANATAKIAAADGFWHRMGDVGYLDDADRFWFCGRKAHRVQTPWGTMYTVPCEAIFNEHSRIYRSALVGVGSAGKQTPVIICQPWDECWPRTAAARRGLIAELYERGQQSELTRRIRQEHIYLHRRLPVDIRHNSKIFREKLAAWASRRIG